MVSFVDQHGRRREKSSGLTDERQAQRLADKIESDAQRLRAGDEPQYPDVTGPFLGLSGRGSQDWKEAAAVYLANAGRLDMAESSRRDIESILRRVARDTGWDTLGAAKADEFTAYLARMASAGKAPGTQNLHLAHARAFLSWCVRQGWLPQNPLAGVERVPKTPRGRRRWRRALTEHELSRLLAAAAGPRSHRDTIYAVAAYSGFRRVELTRLQKEDCTPLGPRPRWHLPAGKTKNGLAVSLPMTAECAEAIRPRWQALRSPLDHLFPRARGLWAPPTVQTLHADLGRAGIPVTDERGRVVDFHALRYTFCALLARIQPVEVVCRLMRHGSLAMTSDLYLDLGLDRTGEGEWTLPPLLAANRGSAGGSAA